VIHLHGIDRFVQVRKFLSIRRNNDSRISDYDSDYFFHPAKVHISAERKNKRRANTRNFQDPQGDLDREVQEWLLTRLKNHSRICPDFLSPQRGGL
jgi:hypothetical protein